MISFSNELGLSTIEDAYKNLYAQSSNYHIDLKIPSRGKFNGFASFASFVQFIITWKRNNNGGKLIIGSSVIDKSESETEEIESSVKRYYGLIASTLSWDDGVINANGKNIKPDIRLENAKLINSLNSKDFIGASRGDSINFPFFDHLESDRGLLSIIYKGQKLCSENDFRNLTEALINTATKNNSVVAPTFEDMKPEINGILFELFENTHKWARKTHTERFLDYSYRGIYSNLFKLERKNIPNFIESNGLKEYFDQLVVSNPSFKFITFLEVSVNDSGSGLAQRYAETEVNEMTLVQEYRFLRECLMKHKTSHKEFGDAQGRGIGLHRTMELLDKTRGFLRVRSGRMHLYRNFLKYPFYLKDESPNYVLFDWNSDSSNPIDRSKVEGTCISLIIPVLID